MKPTASTLQETLFDLGFQSMKSVQEPREQAHTKVKEKAQDSYIKLIKAMLQGSPVAPDSVKSIYEVNTRRSRMFYLWKRGICYKVDKEGVTDAGGSQYRYALTDRAKDRLRTLMMGFGLDAAIKELLKEF